MTQPPPVIDNIFLASEWQDICQRVGRMFFQRKLDTKDISLQLGIPESTVVRALAEYKAGRAG